MCTPFSDCRVVRALKSLLYTFLRVILAGFATVAITAGLVLTVNSWANSYSLCHLLFLYGLKSMLSSYPVNLLVKALSVENGYRNGKRQVPSMYPELRSHRLDLPSL